MSRYTLVDATDHRTIADAILAPDDGTPPPKLPTVAEMTAHISRAYGRPSAGPASHGPTALWVVAVADLGGVARHVLDATRVGVPGWRLVVLCPEGPLAERLRAQGAAVLTAPISPEDSLPQALKHVRATVRALRPAVVHSHLAYSDFLVAGATVGLPVRRFTTEHGIAGNDLVYHGTRWKARVMAAAHHARLHRFDTLIAVSHATLGAVGAKWHPPRSLRAIVIPNGVDKPAQGRIPEPGRLHVVSMCRLAPEKGLFDLLDAFKLVHTERPDARLTMAGQGPLKAAIEARIAELGLDDAVTLPGFVDPAELLPQADVLVQLSVWENCSYTVLDALSNKLPVIASMAGGNVELTHPNSSAPDCPRAGTKQGVGGTDHYGHDDKRTLGHLAGSNGPPDISVVIPTLQRSPRLQSLVQRCATHPLVKEVIIINNDNAKLSYDLEKVRVLNETANIYVNPAWNIGVASAKGKYIALVNDDITFQPEVFDYVARLLNHGRYGIIGVDTSCYLPESEDCRPGHRPATVRAKAFGTFMCFKRTDYVPIPDSLKIWFGDDWLFWHQRRPNAALVHMNFESEMSVTSSSVEFAPLLAADTEAYLHLARAIPRRWWHPVVRSANFVKRVRHMSSRQKPH